MIRLRDLAFLVLGAAIAIFAQGLAAPELQAELGQCRYGVVPEGTFYQSDLHTDSYLRPACGGIALASKWNGSERFGWRVGALATGGISARDNVSTNDERAHAHIACVPPNPDGCMVRFNGEGRTFGFTLGLTAEQPLAAHLSAIAEGGFFFFQHHFKAEAHPMGCGCTGQIAYNETSKLFDSPSPFAGITLRYRDFYVAARHFWPTGHRSLSLTDFSMTQYVVGVAFPFGGKQ